MESLADDRPEICSDPTTPAVSRVGATMTTMRPSATADRHGTGAEAGTSSSASKTGRRLTADARRRQLFEVALSLFAEHGYPATTMDDIAEAAGVTKPLVYQHFESKRALYLELLDVFSVEMIDGIVRSTSVAQGPRQQVEFGFAGYFQLMVDNENAFRLLYGRDAPDDRELGDALRRVEEAIAETIDPLIDADLDPAHRRLLAHAVVGMAEGASRLWLDANRHPGSETSEKIDRAAEAAQLAARLADFAWAGLRQVHRI